MDRDTLAKKAVKHYFEASKDAHDDKVLLHVPSMMADFALVQYEAGQRAERERIYRLALNVHKAKTFEELDEKFDAFTDELRADPAESGE